MSNPTDAVFLHSCAAYHRYLQHSLIREVNLLRYEQTTNREMVVYHGEFFCRIPNRFPGLIPLANTTNVRAHLCRHGVVVARSPSSQISPDTADALAAWYESLF
ncbi:unnamed protein product [Penicillium discolor]